MILFALCHLIYAMGKSTQETNLYVQNLHDLFKSFKLGSEEQRINALKGVEMLVYCGGVQFEQHLLKDPTIINICLDGLNEKGHSKQLQVHFAMCLSVFCQGGFASLEAIFRNGVLSKLTSYLGDKKGEVQKAMLYSVYCLLVKNYERYKMCFKNELLVEAMEDTLHEDWTYWPYNVSQRLTELKDMTAQAYGAEFPSK